MDLEFYDFAVAFFASWSIAAPDRKIPVSNGSLDAAMEKAANEEQFKGIGNVLHFADLRTGRVCCELDSIISAAIISEIIQLEPPSYTHCKVSISSRAGRMFLREYTLAEEMKRFTERVIEYVYG